MYIQYNKSETFLCAWLRGIWPRQYCISHKHAVTYFITHCAVFTKKRTLVTTLHHISSSERPNLNTIPLSRHKRK